MERTINNQPMNKDEIKKRLIDLGINQTYLAKFHRRKKQQINSALRGEQPGLLKRILIHLAKLEQQKKKAS